jgi:hypothetical protein
VSQESLDAFFDLAHDNDDIPPEVERDRWGRPKIIRPDGVIEAYTRASTLAGMLEDKSGLHKWQMRNLTRGMGLREDIAAMVAALPGLTGNKEKDAITKAALDEYAEAARETAGEHALANWGTAVHGFTENGMQNYPYVPERMQADVASFWDRIQEYRVRQLASELFVVDHRRKVAGRLDELWWTPAYGLTVADKKTGKKNLHSVLIQLAIYASGEVYDWRTGRSHPLWEHVGMPQVSFNADVALYVHISRGEAHTEVYPMDLTLGNKAADQAVWVREFRRQKEGLVRPGHNELLDAARREACQEYIALATTREELVSIATEFRDVWNDEMTALGNARLA